MLYKLNRNVRNNFVSCFRLCCSEWNYRQRHRQSEQQRPARPVWPVPPVRLGAQVQWRCLTVLWRPSVATLLPQETTAVLLLLLAFWTKTNRRSRLHKVHQTDLQVPENQSAASDERAGSSHQGIRLLFPRLSQELFHRQTKDFFLAFHDRIGRTVESNKRAVIQL